SGAAVSKSPGNGGRDRCARHRRRNAGCALPESRLQQGCDRRGDLVSSRACVLRGVEPPSISASARGIRGGGTTLTLRDPLAKARPARRGDEVGGVPAASAEERVRAQMALADIPLKRFLAEPIVPYETDEVTRLICDSHDSGAFAPISHLTVGEFRDF